MLRLAKIFVTEILGKAVIEFIWQLAALSLGLFLAGRYLGQELPAGFYQNYSSLIIVILFNAAVLRVILAYALEWMDTELTRLDAAQAETRQAAKTGMKLAVYNLLGKRIPDPEEEKAE